MGVVLLPHQEEIWKDIPGYEGLYQVSNLGRVRSCVNTSSRRKGLLKPYVKNGYLAVNLYKDEKCKHLYVHRLVADCFVENPNGFNVVNHINCNKENNHCRNLEWCSQKHNIHESMKNDLQRHNVVELVEIKTGRVLTFYSQRAASRFLGKYENFINLAIKANKLKHNGYLIKGVMPNVSDKIV